MAEVNRKRGTIKFVFWAALAVVVVVIWWRSFLSGQMVEWYYYTAKTSGYAINSNSFVKATQDQPGILQIGKFASIEGTQAVKVTKGDRLPHNANGIIDEKTLKEGKRAVIEGDKIKVIKPWEIKEKSGFKYKDTFTHKGIKTNPWAAVWNVAMVIGLGLCLGYMAEGFTDLLGIKVKKIQHYAH